MPPPVRRTQEFVDEDGDGIDDVSGLAEAQHQAARWADYDTQMTPAERAARYREIARGNREPRAQEAADRAREEAEAYWSTGEGQRDIDAGRTPRYSRDPEDAAREAYDGVQNAGRGGAEDGGSGGGDGDGPEWLQDFDAAAGDIPFVGGIVGSAARNASNAEERRRAENMALWSGLMGRAPTADDYAVQYGTDQFFEGPESAELSRAQADAGSIEAQREALRGLQEQSSGRLTAADRSRMAAAQMEVGRGMRSQREADAAALQARGMGGSGTEVASMIGAGQAGADALYQRDTAAQVEAQRRALQALQSAGSMASGMRGQSFEEDSTRRSAADDFTRWQTDARRENNRFNVGQGDRTAESRSEARGRAYEDRERAIGGMTGQNSADAQARSAERREQRQGETQTLGLIGELLD